MVPRTALLALLGVIAASVAASAYFTSTSGFYGDDFINFREVQLESGLSLRHLLEPTSAHFAPGHRLGDWLAFTFAPMQFTAVQAATAVMFAASLLLFHRLLSELVRPRPALVLTFVYGVSTVHVAVHQWWASGLDRVPATCLTFLAVLGYVRFHRSGSRPWLATSVVAMVVALLFYVKPIFVPLYLVLLRVLLLHPEESLRSSLAGAWREWRIWALYAAPVAAYSVVYLRAYEAGGQVRTSSLDVVGRYLANLWFRVVAPGMFGIYVPQADDSAVAMAMFTGVQLAVLAGVVWSVARWRGAWRAWVFLAVAVLPNALAVGMTRIGVFGPRYVAYVLLYNLEIVYLVLIAVGAVALGGRRRRAVAPATSPTPTGIPAAARALVGAGLAAYLALTMLGSDRISGPDVWPGSTSRAYVERVAASFRDDARLGIRPVFVDGRAPEPVMFPLAGPWTSHSEVFPVIDRHVSFEVDGRDLFEVAADGSRRPVRFVTDAGGDMTALLGLGVMTYDVGRAVVRDGALCVTAGAATEPVSMAVPAGAGAGRPYVLLHHWSDERTVSALLTEPLGGGPLGDPRFIWLKGGGERRTNVVTLPEGPLQRLYVAIGPHTELCLRRIEIGQLHDR